MDPLDFYEFAKEMRTLSCKFPEASKRTIVGRIYYAIFLMVREELAGALQTSRFKSLYDSLSQKGVIHSLVREALGKIEEGEHLRNILQSMFRRREKADYRMKVLAFDWEREIDDIVLEAEEILRSKSDLKRLFSEKSYEIESIVQTWHSKIATSS